VRSDRQGVEAALAKSSLPDPLKRAFLEEFDRQKAVEDTLMAGIDEDDDRETVLRKLLDNLSENL
jgi:hypothetical protein